MGWGAVYMGRSFGCRERPPAPFMAVRLSLAAVRLSVLVFVSVQKNLSHRTPGRTLRISLQGGPFVSQQGDCPLADRPPGRTLRISLQGGPFASPPSGSQKQVFLSESRAAFRANPPSRAKGRCGLRATQGGFRFCRVALRVDAVCARRKAVFGFAESSQGSMRLARDAAMRFAVLPTRAKGRCEGSSLECDAKVREKATPAAAPLAAQKTQ